MSLLFYLAIPASIWAWRGHSLSLEQRSVLRTFIGLDIIWFITIGYVLRVRDLPRYYGVTTYAMLIPVTLWIRHFWSHQPKKAFSLAFVLLEVFFAGLYIENKNPIFGDRVYVDWAIHNQKILHTDPMTVPVFCG